MSKATLYPPCHAPQLLGEQGLWAYELHSTVRAGFPSPAEDF